MAAHPPPRREVVTGVPRRGPHTPSRTARPAASFARPPAPDEDRLRRLIRAQWRAAVLAGGVLVLLLGSLPLLFALSPALAALRVAGVGIAWVVLGVLAYPVLYAIGRWYVARAEANEAAFTAGSGAAGAPERRRGGWG